MEAAVTVPLWVLANSTGTQSYKNLTTGKKVDDRANIMRPGVIQRDRLHEKKESMSARHEIPINMIRIKLNAFVEQTKIN